MTGRLITIHKTLFVRTPLFHLCNGISIITNYEFKNTFCFYPFQILIIELKCEVYKKKTNEFFLRVDVKILR